MGPDACASPIERVEQRIDELVRPTSGHAVQRAAVRAVGGGKLLRPRLLLAAAGPAACSDGVVTAAAALELLHAALLAHDDVIDRDDERRGAPSVASHAAGVAAELGLGHGHASRVGLATGIVTGDALLVRALVALAGINVEDSTRARLLAIVDRATLRAAEGEHDDVLLAGAAVDESSIMRILQGKTADYSFRAPLEIGALLGGRDALAIEALAAIGMRMGVAYQLRDDVLGVFGEPAVTGKSISSDVRGGAPTLIASLASGHPAWRAVGGAYGDPAADDAAVARVRAAMRESGALDEVERRIAAEARATRTMIVAAPIEPVLVERLLDILAQCVERRR